MADPNRFADSRRVLRRDRIADSLTMILGALIWIALVATGTWVLYPTDALLLLAAYVASGVAYAAIADAVFVRRCREKGFFVADVLHVAFTVALSLAFLLVVRWYPALLLRSATADGFDLIYAVFSLFVFGLSAGGLTGHAGFERLRHVERWSRRGFNLTTGRRSVQFRIREVAR